MVKKSLRECVRVLLMVLVVYESNGNRYKAWERMKWMVCDTCNIAIFWVSNQLIRKLMPVIIPFYYPQDSFAHQALDTTLIYRMVEVREGIVGQNGSNVWCRKTCTKLKLNHYCNLISKSFYKTKANSVLKRRTRQLER